MATMKDIANLLGVELYEEFEIKETCGKYRITEKTIELYSMGIWISSCISLEQLFNGAYELEPWKPEDGQEYYFVNLESIEPANWRNDAIDVALYKMGNCFKTEEEEAEKHREKVAEEIIKAGEDRCQRR